VQPAPDLERIPFTGAVDADGHLLEPPDLWERYLDPAWRERAMRVRTDEHGLDYLELDGRPSKILRAGMLSGVGAMDRVGGIAWRREPTGRDYVDAAPFGSMDPAERLARMDLENIERCLLYPTLNLMWIAECEDEALTQAYLRAYNRFIVDFCADSGGRLVPIAQLSLGDPEAAEAELRRAAADGVRGVWVPPFAITRRAVGHPDHHRVLAAAEELGLPFGIHPSIEPRWAAPGRYEGMGGREHVFFGNVTAADAVRHGFTSMFEFGVFDRLPGLRVVVLESGAGWIGYWLDRMDAVYHSPQGRYVRERLKEPPSQYFADRCYISADPDETTLAALIPQVGADRFFWASDFPHPDHPPDYAVNLSRLVDSLPESARKPLLGRNVLHAYQLD
jgi:predicted TIM-barrel fold metal-dependent hydrolase